MIMSRSNTFLRSLFFLIFFFKLSYCMRNNDTVLCPEIEKESLLSFKQSLKDPDNLLSSWDGEVNCCKWIGVVCDNLTGHVHQLELQGQGSYNGGVSGRINSSLLNLKHLRYLYLGHNSFEGPIPSISNAAKLKRIDLSNNRFNSSIPNWLYFCKDLEYVDLSFNLLEGTISNAIANLTSLNTLYLHGNRLSGEIPKEIANLSKIENLFLSYNMLQGEIPNSFAKLSSLIRLRLTGNELTGNLPDSFAKLSSLNSLYLDYNKLTGNLPESFGQLFNLTEVFIGGNLLMSGVVTETHFANLTNLETFSASGNHLMTLKISANWIPPIQLTSLELSSWTLLEPFNHIPSWLHMRHNISRLDLSNTGISGNVPTWFWEIRFLNLSHNHLHGNIPYIRGRRLEDRPQYMFLSSNQFNGLLPQIGDAVWELDLSNNSFSGGISHFLCDTTYQTYDLKILHLRENQLSGELPNCWTKWPSLIFLNLGNNNMSGTIPNSIGFLSNLRSLNFYNNKFSGQIPSSLHNFTELVMIDLAGNNLDGNIPKQMGTSLVNLRILILRSNRLSGKLSSNLCHLNSLQILDLSNNNFSGIIPKCVFNFTAMTRIGNVNIASVVEVIGSPSRLYYSYSTFARWVFMETVSVAIKGSELQYHTVLALVTNINLSKNNFSGDIPKELASLAELQSLNLSQNQLTGLIPNSIGDMKQLQSLDLSRNLLSGQIPNSLGHMSFLSYLNLSYNNLTGRIPEGTQFDTWNASSFIGNHLCGRPLTRNCSRDGSDGDKDEDEDEGDEPDEIEWFWVLLSLGYAVGLSAVCSALLLKKSWRETYFRFLEGMWNKFYVYIHIKWARLNL